RLPARRHHAPTMILARRFGPALLAIALTAVASPVATAAPGPAPSVVPTGRVGLRMAQKVSRYWTPARMRAARPLGEDGAPADTQKKRPAATPSARVVPVPTAYPYLTAGRIFLKTRRAKAFCSGVAVNTPTRRLVLTAGHCLSVRAGTAIHPESTRY